MHVALELELVAFARDRAAEITRAAKGHAWLQRVGELSEVDVRRDVHRVTKRAPVVHDAIHLRLGDRRLQYELVNVQFLLIEACLRLDIYVVNRTAIVSKSRIRKRELDRSHPRSDRNRRIVRRNLQVKISPLAGDVVTRVAVMDHAVCDLDGCGRVSEQDAAVWFGRWNVDVAEVGSPLAIKGNP